MKNIVSRMGSALALTAVAMPYAIGSKALADDSAPKSDLSEAISVLEQYVPSKVSQKVYFDRDGTQSQTIISAPGFTLAHRNEGSVDSCGLDLKVDDYRINAGLQNSDGVRSSRLKLGKSSDLGFFEVEFDDFAKQDRFVAGAGVKTGNFEFDATSDNAGNFGGAVIWNVSNNGGIGFGGHRVADIDTFNTAFSYKFTSGALEGNKILGQAKISSDDSLEARIRLGDTTPGGAFLVDVKDGDFNYVGAFAGGDGDVTFPFGIGKFTYFGAADCTSGKAGQFGFDLKYNENASDQVLNANVAVGLGSVSSDFLKNNKLQAGYVWNLKGVGQDVTSVELRSTLYEKGNFSFDAAVRADRTSSGEDSYAGFLGLTIKF